MKVDAGLCDERRPPSRQECKRRTEPSPASDHRPSRRSIEQKAEPTPEQGRPDHRDDPSAKDERARHAAISNEIAIGGVGDGATDMDRIDDP